MWAAIGNYLKNKLKDTAIKAALGDESSKRNIIIIGISCVSLFFVVIITVISIIIAPIMMANQLKEDLGEGTKLFFEKVGNVLTFKGWCADSDGSCREKAESKYYDELNSVYKEYKEDNIEIDIELITATIFYGSTLSEESFSESNNSYEKVDIGDISTLASHMVSGNRVDYKKYREYLVDTYIPKRFKDLYIYEDENASIEKIADEIMGFAISDTEQNNINSSTYYGACTYNVAGTNVNTSNLEVVILSCDGERELERVNFEKYIKGVVYGEIGASWDAEVLKAQAIAARSFTLTRNETMCPGRPNDCFYGYNPNSNEIRMRNCEGDQVYCDYTQGCSKYNYNGFNSLISGTSNPNYPVYKHALNGNELEYFEQTLNDVQGLVMMEEDNTIYASAYISDDQNAWNSMFIENSTIDYNEILVKHYWNKTKTNVTISGNCANISGEYANWKQFDPRWNNVVIGNNTVGNVGCLVTSVAIQFARSGTVNLPEFDPGIFANELSKRGSFYDGAFLGNAGLFKTLDELSNGRFKGEIMYARLTGSKEQKIEKLQSYINQGKLLIIAVKYGGHYVAVDRIEDGEVYIFDPGDSYINTVSEKYDWRGVSDVSTYSISQ